MDFAVDGGGDHGGVAQVELAQGAVPVEDGAAALPAQVEERQVAAPLRVDVAVHAFVLRVAPVGDGARGEGREVPLHDLQVVPDLEAGLDEPVGQIRVHRIRADVQAPGEADRAGRAFVGGFHPDVAAFGGGQELLPRMGRPHDFAAAEGPGGAAGAEPGLEALAVGVGVVEIERRNVDRHGDVPVVREKRLRPVGADAGRTHVHTGARDAGQEQQERDQPANSHCVSQNSKNTNKSCRILRSDSAGSRRPACRCARSR